MPTTGHTPGHLSMFIPPTGHCRISRIGFGGPGGTGKPFRRTVYPSNKMNDTIWKVL